MKYTDRSRIFEETNPEVFRAVLVKKHSAEMKRDRKRRNCVSVRFLLFCYMTCFLDYEIISNSFTMIAGVFGKRLRIASAISPSAI